VVCFRKDEKHKYENYKSNEPQSELHESPREIMSSQSYLDLQRYPFTKKQTRTYLLPKERQQGLEGQPKFSRKKAFGDIRKRKAYPKEDTHGLPTLFKFIDISKDP
jgi:hypothetical protein